MDTSIPRSSPSPAQPASAMTIGKGEMRKTAEAAPSPAAAAPSTAVTLSPAAQAAQEASETPEQTAREARGNDRQAQQLVAKQVAVAKMYGSA